MTLNPQVAALPLPVDLYRDIIAHVGGKRDLCALLRVSRAMYAEAIRELYYSLQYWRYGRECQAFDSIIHRSSLALLVRSIHLRIDEYSDFKTINAALRVTTHLLSLHITDTSYDLGMYDLGSIVEGVTFQLRSLHLAISLHANGGMGKRFLDQQSSSLKSLAFEPSSWDGGSHTVLEGLQFSNLRLLAAGSHSCVKGVDMVLKQGRVVGFNCGHRLLEAGPYTSVRALLTRDWVPGPDTLLKFPNLNHLLLRLVSTRRLMTILFFFLQSILNRYVSI